MDAAGFAAIADGAFGVYTELGVSYVRWQTRNDGPGVEVAGHAGHRAPGQPGVLGRADGTHGNGADG
jgi:hypothetical protein